MKHPIAFVMFISLALVLTPAASFAQPAAGGEHWRVTDLLQSTVVSSTGERLGDVEDIVLGGEGQVYAVLIDRGPVFDTEESPRPLEEARRQNLHEELSGASLQGAHFDARDARLEIRRENMLENANGRTVPVDARDEMPVGRFRASAIIGAPVNLADEDGFGEVEDILLVPGTARAAGIVVQAAKGIDVDTYVFPPAVSAFDDDSREMNFAILEEETERIAVRR